MHRKIPIFYSALLLTGVNLLLRLVGTSFQVYLSGRIGAAGIGLLQLVLSVQSLVLVAGIAGIRTATMYLTAEELGRGAERNVSRILSACFAYSILCSTLAGGTLYTAAPWLAEHWIGSSSTAAALRLFAAFLPVSCLCSMMTGYFTAANRIGTLAAVEVGEQLAGMGITMTLLTLWAGQSPGRACTAVVLGSCLGCCLTLFCLVLLRLGEHPSLGKPLPVRSRLLRAALPLAAADVVRSGISTTENLMVPKRLARYPGEQNPLAAFGMVSGMVFPIVMFPACILFGLAELLIPELARCAAGKRTGRIQYLVRRSLRTAMLYGAFFGGLLCVLAQPLCRKLYGSGEAAGYLRWYALLIPFLYCDAITDAMTKGLGQQTICVRYNILTSAMDVAGLFLLLPVMGMRGYYLSFLVTHLLNFGLSLRHLCRITGVRIPAHTPIFAGTAVLAAVYLAEQAPAAVRAGVYPAVLLSLLTLFGILSREDCRWALGLLRPNQPSQSGI